MHVHNIFEILPRLWFENENGDRQIPPAQIQDDPDALDKVVEVEYDTSGGFIFQHCIIDGVLGEDVVCKDPNTDETRIVSREYLPFDHKFVEGLVRNGNIGLRTAMFFGVEACERCQAALKYNYRFGVGYDWDSLQYKRSPARCRICCDPDAEQPEWFAGAKAMRAKMEGG